MKRVFLTGASSGIGFATAQALLAQGHEVWGTSRNPDNLPRLDRFHPLRLDLCDNAEIEKTFADAVRAAGQFDAVINNAGSGHFGPAELLSENEITEQLQILYLSHIRLLQLALAQMRSQGSGLIVNVTSLASRLPVPFMAAYNAAKAAMASYIMSMQLEVDTSPIRIVDLQPGDISTEFNDDVRRNRSDSSYESKVARTWEAVERNMRAAPKPELVARAILRLMDQANPPPRITVGDTFQTKIAPLIFRFLPQRLRIWGLKRYYGI